ncbi:Helix-turn-helix domain-containing protein [Sinosporangium album]|uniref:Helix-turn-helix domain-containing protein n=1 Tax=Sinosporangium album TaxID=504805 RepID=A0A1G7Z2Z4_9ACTN|nr:helix-turn-helix transcriptional regulator [Sinosporangium album]SDH02550.1 Helix-turn-helix domain-containing protein [Sinosporangium album]
MADGSPTPATAPDPQPATTPTPDTDTDTSADSDTEPDPDRVQDRRDFARELSLLRDRAGLTVRQVASKVGAYGAHSTLGDWFAGRGLPSTASRDLFTKVLAACGAGDAAQVERWTAAWRRVRRAPGPRPTGPEPYRGLSSFQPEDAAWFFGRRDLTEQLVARLGELKAAGGGVQVVVGASGSGKSSLLRAGMVAALRAGALPGSADWPIALFTPGDHPSAALAAVRRVRGAGGTGGTPAVLVVDQFEALAWRPPGSGPGPAALMRP